MTYSAGVKWFSLCLFVLLFENASAHVAEDGSVYATVGPLLYQTHELDHSFYSPWGAGTGIIAEGDLYDWGGVEVGIFYLRKTFSVRNQGMLHTERQQQIYITTGYRHWFNDKFSGGLSFFSSYSMGDAQTVRSDFAPAYAPATSASDTTEYGFDLSLQYELWRIKKRYTIVVDGRYSYSVTDKDQEDGNHYGLILGLKYFVQGRDTPFEF